MQGDDRTIEAGGPPCVALAAPGLRVAVHTGPLMQRRAMRWDYVLRSRRRWAGSDESTAEQGARAVRHLQEFGVTDPQLAGLAAAPFIEVVIPYRSVADAWEARVFPWEYVLSAATRPRRGGRAVYVSRRIDRGAGAAARPTAPGAPRTLLYVESAPCRLHERFQFETERRLIADALGVPPSHLGLAASADPAERDESALEVHVVADPTLEELERAVRDLAPDVVHVAGFDTHQGLALLPADVRARYDQWRKGAKGPPRPAPEHRDATAEDRLHAALVCPQDGVLLTGPGGEPDPVPAERIAQALVGGPTPPTLVCFNMFNSGARLAALCVGGGARAAIGFQDEVQDSLTEVFFAALYRYWRTEGWALHAAFRRSWDVLRDHPQELRGTGVMLWTDHAAPALEGDGAGASPGAAGAARRLGARAERAERKLRPADVDRPPQEYLHVHVEPLREINYALLHNRRSLFSSFKLTRVGADAPLAAVSVAVELHVGGESHPCRQQFDLLDRSVSLMDELHVALTSRLARSLRERVRTSLFVEVAWDTAVVLRKTYSVVLLPVHEWCDDDANRSLLPSFVLPTDVAVRTIIQLARKYLSALTGDVSAGFDGYQRDGATTQRHPGEHVDRQVSAIWVTLATDHDIAYVNPPPSYARQSQRIRTPSDVLAATHGTCIDLALLLAACLEYVDIHPVIILLEGHAFPGYWRTQEAHGRFCRVQAPPQVDDPNRPDVERLRSATTQSEPWYLLRDRFDEIYGYVDSGDLVLLETVELTSRGSYWRAVAEGERNLRSRSEFEALLDVRLARDRGVTPIPIHAVEG